MRAFIQLKRMLLTNANLKRKIEETEKKYDKQFAIVFQAIKQLLEPPPAKPKPQIGFRVHDNGPILLTDPYGCSKIGVSKLTDKQPFGYSLD